MVEAAEKARFRHALWQIGEAIAAMFEATQQRSNRLEQLPATAAPSWQELTRVWNE
jgi:hypothetical protein